LLFIDLKNKDIQHKNIKYDKPAIGELILYTRPGYDVSVY